MKTISILFFMMLINFSTQAQTKVKRNPQGEYVKINQPKDTTAKKTGDVYTDSKGVKYPIWVSKNGKYFVLHTSKKTKKEYKHYLKLN